MPIPDEARPAVHQTSIVRRAEHPKSLERDLRILVPADLNTKREFKLGLRHYQCMVPKNWTKYDSSVMREESLQFISPAKDGTTIVFSGYEKGEGSAALFREFLKEHATASKSEPLTKAEIQNINQVFDMFVGNNQYAEGPSHPQFNMTSAEVVTIHGTTPALAVAGEWRNYPEKHGPPEKYWYKLYFDGSGDGRYVNAILYTSDSKASFDKNRPIFDQVLKSLSW